MVDFVLEDAGEKPFRLQLHCSTFAVVAPDLNGCRAWDAAAQLGDAQAAFPGI